MTDAYVESDSEQGQREFRERMAAIVENSPDFVATLTPGGRLLTLNRAGRRLVGISLTEKVAGRPMAQLYPEWASKQLIEVARPTARREGSWTGRSALISADGVEIPTSQVVVCHRDAEGEVTYFSTVVRDLTEERRAENRLKTELEVAKVLDESDSLEHAMPRILKTFVDVLGAARAEFWTTGQGGLDRVFVEVSGEESASYHEPMDNGVHTPELDRDTVILRSVGEVEPRPWGPFTTGLCAEIRSGSAFIGSIALYWTTKNPDHGLIEMGRHVARDIAGFVRRERAEASMLQAQVLAEEANRAKSQFLANMSHEIRTPMAAILGYVELLDRAVQDPDNRRVIRTIRRNAEHLHEIVNDILDLSQIEAGRVDFRTSSVSPLSCASEAVELLRLRAFEQGLELRIVTEGAVPARIQTDALRLRQILLNLLGNALKFTAEGSVTLRVSAPDRAVRFQVEDTGIGMDPSTIESLFEPFNQSDNSAIREFQGTGLGLSIARGLTDVLGGTLWAESAPGEGSTFYVEIPFGDAYVEMLGPEEAEAELENGGEAAPLPPTTEFLEERVLVVDDRVDLLLLVKGLLEGAGAEVATASNGVEAIDAVARGSYSVVIMDLQMPVMDGLTATRILRERGYSGLVIALTAGALPSDREEALEAGCDDYVTKPVDGATLVETILRHLRPHSTRTVGEVRNGGPSQPHILLIEDDEDVASLMTTLFEGWGCTVVVGHSGAEALAVAAQDPVDVVFSDLVLPDVSGTELLPKLKALPTCSGAVFVSLSGIGGEQGQRLSEAAGFERHLVKPAPFDDLKEILSAVGSH